LMEAGTMDMIIFFDELDKVSRTERGQEIIGILTHLTDTTQNSEFNDRYFDGVPIDLSKILFVFSYNDHSLIDPILRDRITNIKTTPMNLDDKLQVTQRFLIPEILEKLGYSKGDLTLTDEQVTYLVNTYTYEAGVRKLKEKLFMIFREYNLKRIFGDAGAESNAIPSEFIEELFRGKPKMIAKSIHEKPRVGMMTGLYATTMGIGGIIPIECFRSVADQKLALVLTGQQGNVMQESMKCARTVAWGLLTHEKQQAIRKDWQEHGTWGLHLHCPEAAMPKDGPSAGGAITIAILSQLAGIKIHNWVGMTGEVNLNGGITAIGGLQSKLIGAKRAGVKLVLIPQENFQDLESLRAKDKSPEDENFKVIAVSRIEEAVRHAMTSLEHISLPDGSSAPGNYADIEESEIEVHNESLMVEEVDDEDKN
jgi:ATP-dependent Lon protease